MKQLNLTAKLTKIVRALCFLEALNKMTAFHPRKLFFQTFEAFFI